MSFSLCSYDILQFHTRVCMCSLICVHMKTKHFENKRIFVDINNK